LVIIESEIKKLVILRLMLTDAYLLTSVGMHVCCRDIVKL